ncbi:hypothetical protein WDW37_05445 [Bdellovibrionota bacterium FG-1]
MTKKHWFFALTIVLILFMLPWLGGYFSCLPSPIKNGDWDKHLEQIHILDDQLKMLAEKIKSNTSSLECEDSSECRVIGLGPKLCEGYNSFLIYSTTGSDEEFLLELVKRFNVISEERNKISFTAERCGVSPAAPYCIRGSCQVITK